MAILFLTGESGSGKTSLLQHIVAEYSSCRLAGFLTPGTMQDNRRATIDLLTLADQQRMPFAQRGEFDPITETRFQFSATGLARAKTALIECQQADLIIVDEVGPMELHGLGVAPELKGLARLPCPQIWVVRPNLLAEVAAYFQVTPCATITADQPQALTQLSQHIAALRSAQAQ